MPLRFASALLAAAFTTRAAPAPDPHPPLRLAVIGLVHTHVESVLAHARDHADIDIVGIWEPDRAVFDRFAAKYHLDPALHHTDLPAMLDATRPEAASVMTSTADHLMAVRACAPRGIHCMVEKPLATTPADARAIADLAREHGIHVLTNYETSWYPSVRAARATIDSGDLGPLRRAVFRHGHPGPREIGCPPEFLAWLTDPEANGAGALFDFGCYGAAIMTWLMDGQPPATVSATTLHLKPEIYPRVDDDATITLAYPSAVAVVQASWAWTHDVKEMDLYAPGGSLHAGRWSSLTRRAPDAAPQPADAPSLAPPADNPWSYLRAVTQGRAPIDPLASLELNVTVVEILEAARTSAATGRTVTLDPSEPRP